MFYPLTFHPIFKERLWGSRKLANLYGKQLPANLPIGESWEISDRPGDASIVDRGPLAGKDLHSLIEAYPQELLGDVPALNGRFPLLAKIIDAQQTLSLQVHPPPAIAAELKAEPKTEMWYMAETEPGAELFAGLRRGVTRRDFEERLRNGTVAECFHHVPVHAGDVMYIPSGRVHAVGAGCVLFEIQQNSDSTYRVFDWNRSDSSGKPRALHIPEALRSIDFSDFEPCLVRSEFSGPPEAQTRPLVSCPYFEVEVRRLLPGVRSFCGGAVTLLAVVRGELGVSHGACEVALEPGRFCLLPAACLDATVLEARTAVEFLVARPKAV